MRVLMLSKACIVGIYQRKLELIAAQGIDLCVLVPPSWKDERGEQILECAYTSGYQLKPIPIRLNGNFHLHHYPTLDQHLHNFQPDILHIDEEAYNLATWQALYLARKIGTKSLFFSWQNIQRDYLPPFSWGETWVFQNVDYALVGTDSVGEILRAKGYTGHIATIPQFGTDADLFQPAKERPERPFTIGYFGRMIPEKGLDILLKALANVRGDWRLRLVGGGMMIEDLQRLAEDLNLSEKIDFLPQLPSTDLPAQYHKIDLFVLPSLTRPNWKEQFGRVLVEAMASGVAVIGSDSGAIPDVIGNAGLIVPEADVAALCEAITRVMNDSALRDSLIEKGRQRFLTHFTQEQIASATVDVYREIQKKPDK